jgi:hypothetical protein
MIIENREEVMKGKIVTVIDTSNYQESYSEPVPFEAEVVDKYDINIVVVSQKTCKIYELYEHQIINESNSSRGENYVFEGDYKFTDGTLIPPEVYSLPKIIKIADLRDVIDKIDREEITMSKGAEILNDIAIKHLNK